MEIPNNIEKDYKKWYSLLLHGVNFSLKDSVKHTRDHCARVLLFALLIADKMGLDQKARDILGTASVFHDTRRHDDWLDVGHGKRAAEYYKSYCRQQHQPFQSLVYDIMAFHDRDDALGIETIGKKYQEPQAVLLYKIFKDADALDRFRLGPHGLDPRYLRTAAARSLYGYAKRVWKQWEH